MLRSLRARLLFLLALLIVAAIAAGALMIGLFRQSASAQAGKAKAEIGRACDAIVGALRAVNIASNQPERIAVDEGSRREFTRAVEAALRDKPGIEGGIWQDGEKAESLAYAFPTYQGSGPKTDVPEAELSRIQAVNAAALGQNREDWSRYDASSQILLLTACPLGRPFPELTAWAMTRVYTFAGSSYLLLTAGICVLFATVLAAAALLTRLTLLWSRHVSRIEAALNAHDIADLPKLAATGEGELDRIVTALNEAGRRLAGSRRRAERLAREVAAAERLAAIGRLAAGLAHEIRNPIAAMRLKAENALAADDENRRQSALHSILQQITRLDGLLRDLLAMTQKREPKRAAVDLAGLLERTADAHRELAANKGVKLATGPMPPANARLLLDAEQIGRALDNLILNAIENTPAGGVVELAAEHRADKLCLRVRDSGQGVPDSIRERLFEPFITGRAGGTGLGLATVREIARAHGGEARLVPSGEGAEFEFEVPWLTS